MHLKKYSGESNTAIVTGKGASLTLSLKRVDSQETADDDVFLEGVSGEIKINESKLSFSVLRNDDPNIGKDRFMTTISMASILGDKHLSDGDTLVFILKSEQMEGTDFFNSNGITQFYYQLQDDNWQSKDDTTLFQNNNCINFESPELSGGKRNYYFIMPLNMIKNPEDYNNLQFFFDVPKGIQGPLELECSVNYSILPASQKAFVFGVGKNWDGNSNQTHPYRYECNIPLVVNSQKCVFAGGETVEVTLSGKVMLYKGKDGGYEKTAFTSESFKLGGELYDGAEYNSIKDEWKSFHPLSNTQTQGLHNVKELNISEGEFNQGSTYRFESIQTPGFDLELGSEPLSENFVHDYKIQCTIPCSNPSDIFLIQNFGIETTVTPGN